MTAIVIAVARYLFVATPSGLAIQRDAVAQGVEVDLVITVGRAGGTRTLTDMSS